jgi:hypothetical protein
MNLKQYRGKYLRIVDSKNRLCEGKASFYIYAEDNEPENIEAIVIDCCAGHLKGNLVEFTESEIKSIEIIEKSET